MRAVSTRLATWAAETPGRWPDEAFRAGVRAFIDTVACILAGATEPVVQKTTGAVEGYGSGKATVVGRSGRAGSKFSPPWAALINGAAAHSQDYDDVLEPASAHASAVLVPAILALAEDLGVGGYNCLDAYIVGFEMMTRLGELFNPDHYQRGWHTTLTLGAPSVAAACGRMMGLDKKRIQAAINMSTSLCSGSKRQFGSMTKPLHAGFAAMNGLMAARLAEKGITTAEEMFEGPWSLSDLMAAAMPEDNSDPLERLGNPLGLIQYGSWLKVYPCCASTHRSIDALLELQKEHRIELTETECIEGMLSTIAADNLMYALPNDPAQAKFSLPYCLISALVDGDIGPMSFTTEALQRAHVRERLASVQKIIHPEFDKDQSSRVSIRMKDGRNFSQWVEVPRGHPKRPLSDPELAEKFKLCTNSGGIEPAKAEKLLSLLNSLPTLPRTETLTFFLNN